MAGDVSQRHPRHPPQPHIYESLGNNPADHLKVLVRPSSAPLQLVDALRRTIRSLDPHIPIDRAAPFAAWLGDAMVASRRYTPLFASFPQPALALEALGVECVAAYAVIPRATENDTSGTP